MKRLTITLIAIFGFAAALNAQISHVMEFLSNEGFAGIPSCFTNNGHTHLIKLAMDGDSFVCSFYDNDLTTKLLDYECANLLEIWCKYYDVSDLSSNYSQSQASESYEILFCFTQNLFNSDDHYEYIETFETGWYIKSTNGSIVQTINTEDGFAADERYRPCFFKLDDIFYLGLVEGSATDTKMLIFNINQTTGLTKVDIQLPISVFPTMPTREQQITVELGEGNNAKEITVVNNLGQVVKRVPVQEGQREVIVSVSDLGSGLNVVNTRTEQGQGSCKIIVR